MPICMTKSLRLFKQSFWLLLKADIQMVKNLPIIHLLASRNNSYSQEIQTTLLPKYKQHSFDDCKNAETTVI